MITPPEVEDQFRVRAHAIIRSWLPMVTKVLTEALLQLVRREEVERQLEWLDVRRQRLVG
jgi:hypothetical protein